MSKRVANTKQRTARNGRVRLHWTTQRKQEHKRQATAHEEPFEAPAAKEKPIGIIDRARRIFRHQKRGS